jgi:hypothetical protein
MAIGRFGVNGLLARELAMVERRVEDGRAQTLSQVGQVLHVSGMLERCVRVTSLLHVQVEPIHSFYLAFIHMMFVCCAALHDLMLLSTSVVDIIIFYPGLSHVGS